MLNMKKAPDGTAAEEENDIYHPLVLLRIIHAEQDKNDSHIS